MKRNIENECEEESFDEDEVYVMSEDGQQLHKVEVTDDDSK